MLLIRTLPISRHPIVRMPVFVMGIIAGLQKIREVNQEQFSDPNLSKIFLHDIIPWGVVSCWKESGDMGVEKRTRKWIHRVYLAFLIITASVSYFFTKKYAYKYNGFVVWDYGLVHLQLLMVQGLINDGGHSIVGMILRTQPLRFLGKFRLISKS